MDIDPRVLPNSQNEEQEQEPVNSSEGGVTPENTHDLDDLKRKAEVSSQNFERAKKAELEVKELRKLLETKSSDVDDDYLSDEGKALKSQITNLEQKIVSMESNQTLERISNLYPAIKEKSEEFEEFKAEYPGIALDKIAKLFVVEKGYGEQLKARIGLEKPTGGSKNQPKSGISVDEVKRLRETQPRRYQQMLRDGRLNPDDII